MSDLLKLAERCEQATGPDRQLDVHIVATVFPQRFDDARSAEIYRTHRGGYNCADREFLDDVAPRVTASLDAAMTLVPDGWAIIVGAYPDARKPFARLFPPDYANSPLEHQESNDCASHAIALCAAALRARAAQ